MWFEGIQYCDKKVMNIENLVETKWMVWYPWPADITYEQGGEFLGQKCLNILI